MSANLPAAFVAVRTRAPSGCWLLIGETGVGAVTFSVEPSGPAAVPPPSTAVVGETGVVGWDFPHATANARLPAHAQIASFFKCIQLPHEGVWESARWDRAFVGFNDTTRPQGCHCSSPSFLHRISRSVAPIGAAHVELYWDITPREFGSTRTTLYVSLAM